MYERYFIKFSEKLLPVKKTCEYHNYPDERAKMLLFGRRNIKKTFTPGEDYLLIKVNLLSFSDCPVFLNLI